MSDCAGTMKVPMGPPPPREPKIQGSFQSDFSASAPSSTVNGSDQKGAGPDNQEEAPAATKQSPSVSASTSVSNLYSIPAWSEAPGQRYYVEVLKDGVIIDTLDVSEKGAYMFGRSDQCDFILEHPTISRYHAVLQYKGNGDAFLYDLGSTHGSFVNKAQVRPNIYQELYVGDVLRFGHSSRLYILQGPIERMPSERPIKSGKHVNEVQHLEEIADMEASILRAKREASLADGISWGMMEDAIDEDTKEVDDEVTWQTYTGELTERQEKTKDKIIKRNEKVANLKKEIDAIQAKEIAQGGLTQGQQTQIARNELRMQQIAEELESLEEALNESIQESIGARTGRVGMKKKGVFEDEDDGQSDDDEFYDRTKKGVGSKQKAEEQQIVETAETLLEKKEIIAKEIANTMASLQAEESCNHSQNHGGSLASDDPLDAFMSGLSSQIVKDRAAKLQRKLERLQSEMERVVFLLKIADPTGEASQNQESQLHSSTHFQAGQSLLGSGGKSTSKNISSNVKDTTKSQKGNCAVGAKHFEDKTSLLTATVDAKASQHEKSTTGDSDKEEGSTDVSSDKTISATMKPRWLGAVHNAEDKTDTQQNFSHPENAFDSSEFVGYKDRKEGLTSCKEDKTPASILEDAEGLVIRKPKGMDCKTDPRKVNREDNNIQNASLTGMDTETSAEDAVALLLRHKQGLASSDEHNQSEDQEHTQKKRKKLGPEKPVFLTDDSTHYDAWLPPQGQTGDGRTSLNDKYGY